MNDQEDIEINGELDKLSTTNTDHGGDGDSLMEADDGPYDPSTLLNHDMWLYIFGFLKDESRDLINLADSCQYFRQLVETPRPAGVGAPREDCRLDEVLPLVFKWLERDEILAMRPVSQRTSNTVDTILQNEGRITKHNNLGLFPRLLPPFPNASESRCSFEWEHLRYKRYEDMLVHVNWPGVILKAGNRIENFQNFLETQQFVQTGSRKGAHIVGRTISLEGTYADGESEETRLQNHTAFIERSLEFFRACRHHRIQRLRVKALQMASIIDVYRFICNLCGGLPFLKSLHLFFKFPRLPLGGEAVGYTPEMEQELDTAIRNHQLPSAPHLESFSLIEIKLPRPFVRHLAEAYGAQLRFLEFEIGDFPLMSQRPDPIPEYEFPVLEELKVVARQTYLPFLLSIRAQSVKALEVIDTYDSNEWIHERSANPLVELIEAVNSFTRIESLHLEFRWQLPEVNYTDPRVMNWVQEPQQSLRNLRISTDTVVPHLRFFSRWFPNIEHISIKEECDELGDERDDEDLKLLEEGALQMSTIWLVAARLETVSLRIPNFNWQCSRPSGL